MDERILQECMWDPVLFIEKFIPRNELGHPFILFPHQKEILRAAFTFDDKGHLPWDTIVWSCPKKSGKTTINAAITLWWAFTQDAPNEIPIVANDLEQSQSRVFRSIRLMLLRNPYLLDSATPTAVKIEFSNGTVLTPIAREYTSAAGSNHGLTSWDELWGYTSESSSRLWEELTPVPTRRNSIRLVTTYAGWEGESKLLLDLYKQAVDKEEDPGGKGERIHPTLPIFVNRERGLFVYWDHTSRMPWQTTQYYKSQKSTLRGSAYIRIHENRWTVAETSFVNSGLWDPCVHEEYTPLLPYSSSPFPLYVGVDAGIKDDTAAIVCVRREGEDIILSQHRIFTPTAASPLDIENTLEAYLIELYEKYKVAEILCDPYQMHRSITTLRAQGLPIEEFPQTVANCTLMGQTLFSILRGKNLKMYPSEELRTQALNTVAIESPRGYRIAKERATKKIDSIVALSMACVAATRYAPINAEIPGPTPLGQRQAFMVGNIEDMEEDRRSVYYTPRVDEGDLVEDWVR